MSMEVKLQARKRDERGKEAARRLRAEGRIPAVLYGRGSEPLSLSLEGKEAEHLFQSISVENTIVGLEIDGERAPVQTLIREIQVHPFRPVLFHVDFYRIRKGEKLEVNVPVRLHGTPEGVRSAGGVLQHSLHEIAVRCVPAAIPDAIDVDVGELELGGSVHVSDLNVPAEVEILLDAELVVCSVVAPRVAEPEEEVAEAEAAEAEVEGEAVEEPGEPEE